MPAIKKERWQQLCDLLYVAPRGRRNTKTRIGRRELRLDDLVAQGVAN
jgi:hypothetical protein